jgi:predicted enzyme related to lactoylglutathione lyase
MAARKRTRARRKVSKSSKASRKTARKARPRAGASRKRAARPSSRSLRRKAPARRPAPASPRPAAPPPVPNAIGLTDHHTDYTSHDMDGIKRFYTEILGFTRFDHDPQMNYLYLRVSPTSSLGFMPPMPGPPEQWRPPREPALYFMVEDVDQAHRDLQAKGVTFDQAPADMPWGHRVALLRDPEGRRVCLAQAKQR